MSKFVDALLGGIPSAISSVVGSALSLNENSKNRKFQAEQAELQRQFNAEQAQLGRDFTERMYLTNRDYSIPLNEKRRLESAGLHPAFFMGNGSNAAFPSSAVASSSASPAGSSLPPQVSLNSADDYLKIKQAQSVEQDTIQKQKDNLIRDILNSQTIQLNGLDITLKTDQHALNEQQAALMAEKILNLHTQTDKLSSEISKLSSEIDLNKLEYSLKRSTFEFEKAILQSESEIKRNEANLCAQLLSAEIALNRAQTLHALNSASECAERVKLIREQCKTQLETTTSIQLANTISQATQESAIKKIKLDADWQIVDKVIGSVGDVVDAINVASSIFRGIKNKK